MSSEATGETPSDHLSVSTRDDSDLRDRLGRWLAARPEVGQGACIDSFERPEANGLSSETLLFDASWDVPDSSEPAGPLGSVQADPASASAAGASRRDLDRAGADTGGGRFVARLAPTSDAFPVFPSYDLERQVRVMRLVGDRSSAPVPLVRWHEPDDEPLGSPFFVMDRVDGQVPPDVMPYPFDGSWVSEATPEQRARLQARSVDLLAAIHGVEASADELAFLEVDAPGDTPLRRHFAQERQYYDWVRGELRFPVIERAFAWLEAHWPQHAEQATPVISWGDARIGNVLYEDFEPRAVLDWEMATLGPRELDVGWFIFLHRFFDDIATEFEMAGLPDFLQRDEVSGQYAERTGHTPRDLDWFITYAATRHGSIMVRTMWRRIQFGEQPMPDDPQDLVLHRRTIEDLIRN